jgi:hypothetical protein
VELEIDEIEVQLTGTGWDEEEVEREIERYLTEALERVTREPVARGWNEKEIVELNLPPLDWEAEADKTGKLVQLIIAALEAK